MGQAMASYDQGRSDEEVDIVYDELITSTEKAMLYRIDNLKVWIPKSQILHSTYQSGSGTLTIPEWLAIEKELV